MNARRYNLTAGFTLLETLMALTIGAALLGLMLSVYILALRTTDRAEDTAELTQNSRLILERLTRDLRQARQIVTNLPPTKDDPNLASPQEIEMQDGHNPAAIQYIRYYLVDRDLRRQIKEYYLAGNPAQAVIFNATDEFGNPAAVRLKEDFLVGQYVDSWLFYGRDLITAELSLIQGEARQTTKTAVYGRNF